MLDKINQLDIDLFLYLNSLGDRKWDWFWLIITEKWTSIPLFVVLLFLTYKKFNAKVLGISCLAILVIITLSDQLAGYFKYLFMRPRPCNEEFIEYGRFVAKRCAKYGFYSAHASTTFALAVFFIKQLKDKYPKIGYWLLFWAIVVTYSRIYIGVHYPGDILVGLCIGLVLGYSTYFLFEFLMKKIEKRAT